MILCFLNFFLLLLITVASPTSAFAAFSIFYFSMAADQYNIGEDPLFRQTAQGLSLAAGRLQLPSLGNVYVCVFVSAGQLQNALSCRQTRCCKHKPLWPPL